MTRAPNFNSKNESLFWGLGFVFKEKKPFTLYLNIFDFIGKNVDTGKYRRHSRIFKSTRFPYLIDYSPSTKLKTGIETH